MDEHYFRMLDEQIDHLERFSHELYSMSEDVRKRAKSCQEKTYSALLGNANVLTRRLNGLITAYRLTRKQFWDEQIELRDQSDVMESELEAAIARCK